LAAGSGASSGIGIACSTSGGLDAPLDSEVGSAVGVCLGEEARLGEHSRLLHVSTITPWRHRKPKEEPAQPTPRSCMFFNESTQIFK
jgi:hypothetical protein